MYKLIPNVITSLNYIIKEICIITNLLVSVIELLASIINYDSQHYQLRCNSNNVVISIVYMSVI